jgi:hypothetical protein
MTNVQRKKGRRFAATRLLLFATIGLALAVYACYPGGATDVADFDLVITLYDENFDYSALETYAMPDSVKEFPDSTQTIDPTTEQLILQLVADNMAKYGYKRIITPDTNVVDSIPDVVVLCRALTQDYAAFTTYPWWGYWGGWYGGWYPPYPGWGWGYPPGGVSVSTFTVGALLIDMAPGRPDPDDEAAETLQGVWGAGMNGVLSNSLQADQARLKEMINRAFEQSPYLDQN